MKDKIVFFTIVDGTPEDVHTIAEAIESLDLPYHFMISNKNIESWSLQELKQVINKLEDSS